MDFVEDMKKKEVIANFWILEHRRKNKGVNYRLQHTSLIDRDGKIRNSKKKEARNKTFINHNHNHKLTAPHSHSQTHHLHDHAQ